MEYRLGTTSASDKDDSACASGDDEKDDDICKDDLAKEMTEIRELRTRIRSLESELKQRLKGLRDRANRGKANRSQIVRFINEIEGMIIVLSAPSQKGPYVVIRGSQRDVVHLGWPIATSYTSPIAGEGLRGLSNEYSCVHNYGCNHLQVMYRISKLVPFIGLGWR